MYTNSAAFCPRGTVIQFEAPGSTYFEPLAEIKNINFSGAKYDLADVTNYESGNFREWLTTLADSGEVSFEGNYIPGDPRSLRCSTSSTMARWFFGRSLAHEPRPDHVQGLCFFARAQLAARQGSNDQRQTQDNRRRRRVLVTRADMAFLEQVARILQYAIDGPSRRSGRVGESSNSFELSRRMVAGYLQRRPH